MKKKILYLIMFVGCFAACNNIPVGFLDAANGEYTPDSLVIKGKLDPENPADADRIKFAIPWQSNPIQGVDGTPQLVFSVTSVADPEGVPQPDVQKQIYLVGAKARITVANDHTIPAGRYILDMKVENEDHEYYFPKVFTLIVE